MMNKAKIENYEKFLNDCYDIIESYIKNMKKSQYRDTMTLTFYAYNYIGGKNSKEEYILSQILILAKSMEIYSKIYNEARFYKELFSEEPNYKKNIYIFEIKKAVPNASSTDELFRLIYG